MARAMVHVGYKIQQPLKYQDYLYRYYGATDLEVQVHSDWRSECGQDEFFLPIEER